MRAHKKKGEKLQINNFQIILNIAIAEIILWHLVTGIQHQFEAAHGLRGTPYSEELQLSFNRLEFFYVHIA